MDLFKELKKLDLPEGEFLVLGSGILGALGIRAINDIDLLVTQGLFDQLKEQGWKYEVIEIEGRLREKISNGPAEAFKDFWWKGGALAPETAIPNARKINGISFLPLSVLLEVKRGMGREKDLKDVVLIEKYLKGGFA